MGFSSSVRVLFAGCLACRAAALVCDNVHCDNEGFCVEGEADFSGHKFIEEDELVGAGGSTSFHCQCSDEWTGKLCAISVVDCLEDHMCYHGGTCISGLTGKTAEGRGHLCNCREAIDHDYKYDGKYCEHKIGTQEEHESGDFLKCPCINGGVCGHESPRFEGSCDCPPGFHGSFCQFEDVAVPECALECFNGGYCVFGEVEDFTNAFQYYPDTQEVGSVDFEYCHCPNGFNGRYCEVASQKCGDGMCYHGATCVEDILSDGILVQHCDCRTARSKEGQHYAGLYCQFEETASCSTSHNIEQSLFCVNNGECKEDGVLGCECPEGFLGFSCEFIESGSTSLPTDDVSDCTLDCGDKGTCRHGIKEISGLGDAAHAGYLSITHEDFQHCVCEEGYTGFNCDYSLHVCEETEDLFCLHGAKCEFDSNGLSVCDCQMATGSSTERFYGQHCEFLITSVCSVSAKDPISTKTFCVNDGECKRVAESHQEHYGCNCPGGWAGEHCEVKMVLPRGSTACTEGDATDTSGHFCHHGGTCLAVVDRGFVHPGCNCTNEWTGLQCDEPKNIEGQADDRRPRTTKLISLTVVFLSLAVILSISVKLVLTEHWNFRPVKNLPQDNYWKSSNLPDTGEHLVVNLAPRRVRSSDDEELRVASNVNPSRDPFAEYLSSHHPDMLSKCIANQMDTQLYFDPPLDEDGHPLHALDII